MVKKDEPNKLSRKILEMQVELLEKRLNQKKEELRLTNEEYEVKG